MNIIDNLSIDLQTHILNLTLELRKPKHVLNTSLKNDIKTAYKIREICTYYKENYSNFYYTDFLENDLLHTLNDDQPLYINNLSPRLLQLFHNYEIEEIIDILSISNEKSNNQMRNIYKYWFWMTPKQRIMFYKRYIVNITQ